MPANAADIYETIKKIRYDLTAAQAKLTDLTNMLNTISIPTLAKYTCTKCPGGLQLPSQQHLDDHLQLVHEIDNIRPPPLHSQP